MTSYVGYDPSTLCLVSTTSATIILNTVAPLGSILLRSTCPVILADKIPACDILYSVDVLKIPLPGGCFTITDTFGLCPSTRYFYRIVNSCASAYLSSLVTIQTDVTAPALLSASVTGSCLEESSGRLGIDFAFVPSYPISTNQTYVLTLPASFNNGDTNIIVTVTAPSGPVIVNIQGIPSTLTASYSAAFRMDGTIRVTVVNIAYTTISSTGISATFAQIATNGILLSAPITVTVPAPVTSTTTCAALFGTLLPLTPVRP